MSLTAQNQVQALQAAVNAGAAQQNQRNPLWNVQGFPPPMLGGLPPNFYPQMQAAAAANENAYALVATAKLGNTKKSKDGNSELVVRSSVRKLNANGGVVSVGSWARKVVEDNLEWLVKLARRNFPKENAIHLAYGDGCETLVLFDDHVNKMPTDFASIKKIGVGVSVADSDANNLDTELAKTGVLQAGDPVWEHLKFHQIDRNSNNKEKSLYIHTSMNVWSDGVDGRQRVVQVKTKAPSKPFMAVSYARNAAFEQQVLAKWKGKAVGTPLVPVAPVLAPAASVQPPAPVVAAETLITFNPKELLLLEKAFDNALTPRDLKTDVSKFTAEDKRKCQSVIRRATEEIVTTTKKRRKKAATTTATSTKKAAVAKPAETKPESPAKAAKKATPKKKTPVKKAEDGSDSDDEPISTLKPKSSSKAAKKKEAPKSPKKEEEPSAKKRGRPSKSSKAEPPSKKTRGKSKSKK
jgi:hypothetical protein